MLGENSYSLHRADWLFIPKWCPDAGTLELARSIGDVVDIRAIMPESAIQAMQTLLPRRENSSRQNRYSGIFGLGEFPLHTDLAHWSRPPRYLMIRCILGHPDVTTKVISSSKIVERLGKELTGRALFLPRRALPLNDYCLLPMVFRDGMTRGLRWDSVFVVPANDAARRVSIAVNQTLSEKSGEVHECPLVNPGDTLIIDNWNALHGRSGVPMNARRIVERVYLSEIHTL